MSNEKKQPSLVEQFLAQNNAQKGIQPDGGSEAASIGARALASTIDSLIIWVVGLAIAVALRGDKAALFLSWILHFLYAGYFYKERGATLGKLAMNIKVVDVETGRNLTFIKGAFRDTLGKALSALILMVGFLMAFFTKDRRALHDFIFQSRVVRKGENPIAL